jgi:hypothetical protein
MDKETLSHYGWIVILTLILSVLLALGTPFGKFVAQGTGSILKGYTNTNNKVLSNEHIDNLEQELEDYLNSDTPGWNDNIGNTDNGNTGDTGENGGNGETSNVYSIIEGAGQTTLSSATAVFRSDAPFDKFDSVKVDGSTVGSNNYTVTAGSTVVTFNAAYLSTLSKGSHTLEVVSTDGSASCEFTKEFEAYFTVDGKKYEREPGYNKTWYIWYQSEFNVDGFQAVSAADYGEGCYVRFLATSDGYALRRADTHKFVNINGECLDVELYVSDILAKDVYSYQDVVVDPDNSDLVPGEGQISFTIDGTIYLADEGMTWGEWVKSDYNNGFYSLYSSSYISRDGQFVTKDYMTKVRANNTITSGFAYVKEHK